MKNKIQLELSQYELDVFKESLLYYARDRSHEIQNNPSFDKAFDNIKLNKIQIAGNLLNKYFKGWLRWK